MSDKKYEKDDAEKAEKHDDEEDKDYKKSKETGRSEKGYERDDAEKAEDEDDREDADYDKGKGEDGDARYEDEKANHDSDQAEDGNEPSDDEDDYDLDADRKEALAALDARYALRKEHNDLIARMDALEAKFGAMHTTPEGADRYTVSLDDELNAKNK